MQLGGRCSHLLAGFDVASAVWLGHCGLAQDPCVVFVLCCKACVTASFYVKVLVFVSIS